MNLRIVEIIDKDLIEDYKREDNRDLTLKNYYGEDNYVDCGDYAGIHVIDVDTRKSTYLGDTGHNSIDDLVSGFEKGLDFIGQEYSFGTEVQMTAEKLKEWKNKIFDFE